MSFVTVAKKDFKDSARSRWLWALSVIFVLLVGGLAYLFTTIPGLGGVGESASTVVLLFALLSPSGVFVPIIGMMISYKSIVGERESGTLKLLLSLPHERADVVAGKLLGRSMSLLIAVVIGFTVGLVVFAVQIPDLNLSAYVLFLALTLLFGVVYISIGVGLSSLTASASRALALAVTFIVLFEFLWGVVPVVLLFVVNGFSLSTEEMVNQPDWAQFLGSLSPGSGYQNAATAILPRDPRAGTGVAPRPDDPFFLQNEFGLVVLAFWLVGPLVVGYLRFRGADLS